jgi:periplasmic divalent cation tolerance protein
VGVGVGEFLGLSDMIWIAYSTLASEQEAKALALELVSKRMVACVNIFPRVLSVYEWNGRLEQSEECLLMMKLAESQREPLKSIWVELHPYELPELLFFRSEDGHSPYLEWVRASSRSE